MDPVIGAIETTPSILGWIVVALGVIIATVGPAGAVHKLNDGERVTPVGIATSFVCMFVGVAVAVCAIVFMHE